MPQIFSAVIMGNAVCLLIWYTAWRIRKDEKDTKAIVMMLGCFLFIALMGWSARPPAQESQLGQAHSSASAAPAQR